MNDRFYSGYRLSQEDMNSIITKLFEQLNVGPGMRKMRVGNKVVVGLTRSQSVGGGTGALPVTDVLALPAIPTGGGIKVVRWLGTGGGTGDGGLWVAWPDATVWFPWGHLTDKSGAVV